MELLGRQAEQAITVMEQLTEAMTSRDTQQLLSAIAAAAQCNEGARSLADASGFEEAVAAADPDLDPAALASSFFVDASQAEVLLRMIASEPADSSSSSSASARMHHLPVSSSVFEQQQPQQQQQQPQQQPQQQQQQQQQQQLQLQQH